jgi:hypothetical protein
MNETFTLIIPIYYFLSHLKRSDLKMEKTISSVNHPLVSFQIQILDSY